MPGSWKQQLATSFSPRHYQWAPIIAGLITVVSVGITVATKSRWPTWLLIFLAAYEADYISVWLVRHRLSIGVSLIFGILLAVTLLVLIILLMEFFIFK
ncbi:hypothetical protein [Levilactobacillus bambusae]|uniref:Uncharacterized protein n=1 Tax=Levilactobacillus bambusae TaxID=2024736 RepID=A0A2V1MZT8_9LACO|nr:hypothetical protein [Levilactobacillus bambusae]PWG00283.1 hypothetical protein DCM90_04955 [Levilactobacillus bambusae]